MAISGGSRKGSRRSRHSRKGSRKASRASRKASGGSHHSRKGSRHSKKGGAKHKLGHGEAYCPKCKVVKKVVNPKLETTARGGKRMHGTCPTCHGKVGVFVAKDYKL